ncbi:MAG: 4Fe-4S binding protein [Candidatus Eisenbacteria bacterium]
MSDETPPLHFVCTLEEARKIVDSKSKFWVSNCGCRELRGKCDRSRMDVCLQFCESTAADGSGIRRVTRDVVEEILKEAQDKHLVTRPFRDEATKTKTEGICFCCDDCCGYFTDPEDNACDAGSLIESTDTDACIHCGLCADVCRFGAREMADGELKVDRDKCFGCGLCADVCPEDCITMVSRK